MEKDLIKELHQMNIYLKSIAESLSTRKVILKAKPENIKKLKEQVANSSDGGILLLPTDLFDGYIKVLKEGDEQ